jgi:hypothetical protein
LKELPGVIDALRSRRTELQADRATAAAHAGDAVTVAGRAYGGKDLFDMLGGQLDRLPDRVWETRHLPLGRYRGLEFGIVLHPHGGPEAYLRGAALRQVTLGRDRPGPRALLNALERLAGGYGLECERVRQDLTVAEHQLRDYGERLGQPFAHDAYLAELAALRDRLKAGLSGAPEEQPAVAEVAGRIKALKAGHAVEAAAERLATRRAAEVPVTRRIRRTVERPPDESREQPATVAVKDAALAEAVTNTSPGDGEAPRHATHRERLTGERLKRQNQRSLF